MSVKTHKILILLLLLLLLLLFPDKSFLCLLKYHNNFRTIPVTFLVNLVFKYQDDIFRYYKGRQSQQLQRFDPELNAI